MFRNYYIQVMCSLGKAEATDSRQHIQAMRQSFQKIYAGLLVFRVFFAIFGTGYIHPDEYFQNGEIMAGESLNGPIKP